MPRTVRYDLLWCVQYGRIVYRLKPMNARFRKFILFFFIFFLWRLDWAGELFQSKEGEIEERKRKANTIQFLFSIIHCFVGIINVTRLLCVYYVGNYFDASEKSNDNNDKAAQFFSHQIYVQSSEIPIWQSK